MPHGQGLELYENGGFYEGEYFKGKKQGFGQLKIPGHYDYLGEFDNNQFSGHGIKTFSNKSKYEGFF